jgi:hypothetical protein
MSLPRRLRAGNARYGSGYSLTRRGVKVNWDRGRKALNSALKTELSSFGLAAFYRAPMNDLKVERLFSLKSLRRAQGVFELGAA